MTHTKNSLYRTLIVIIIASVALVKFFDSWISYLSIKERYQEELSKNSQKLLSTLEKNIMPNMAAYQVHEYDTLSASQMEREEIAAILIRDFNMGKILGRTVFISGYIRDANGKIAEIDLNNPYHQSLLHQAYDVKKQAIVNSRGEMIGSVEVYLSDEEMHREIRQLISHTLFKTIAIAGILIFILFWAIRRFVLQPITDMVESMRETDKDGIPLSHPHIEGISELEDFSDTIVTMLDTIKHSRQVLQTQNEGLLKTEHMFIMILELSPIAVRITRRDTHTVVFANDAYASLLKKSRKDILGSSVKHFYIDESEYRNIVNVIQSGESIYNKLVELKVGEERIWTLSSYMPFEFEGTEAVLGWFYDITPQKRLEEQLRKEKEFINTIVRNADSIIAMIRDDGTMSYLNEYGQHFTGYSLDEIASEPYFWNRFLSDEVRLNATAMVENARNGHIIKHFNSVWVSRRGKVRSFQWSNALVLGEDGTMDYLLMIGIDITEQIKLQELMNEERRRYKSMMELASDGIFIMDSKGKLVEFSAMAAKMLGYDFDEMFTLSIGDWDAMMTDKEIENLINGLDETPISFETRHKRKDGTIYDASITAVAIYLGEKYIYASARDITTQKEAEARIKVQKEEFETIFNISKDGIAILDLESNFLDFNESYLTMTGYSREELLNRSCIGLSVPEDIERSKQAIKIAKEEGALTDFEKSCMRKDGMVLIINMSVSMMPDKQRILITTKDVTEKRKLEDNLRVAKETAERANRAKSEFLANMSHEIRTPLNGVTGLIDLTLKTDLNDKQRDYMIKARHSSKALLGVINDILDYSKIEAGKLDFEHRVCSISRIVRDVGTLFEYAMEEKRLDFIVDIDPSTPDAVLGDPLRISQIFNNLVGNAIKFTERGTIFIRVKPIEFEGSNVRMQCAVGDTGIGMTPEEQSLLFSAFSQTDASNSRKYGGSGLGLTICRQLSELMGGKIWVESVKGEGTTFYFTLMLETTTDTVDEESSEYSTNTAEEAKVYSGEVLLVEDNAVNQLVAKEMLEGCGLSVRIANNGLEACDIAATAMFDMIFMDLQMPVMDGFEAARRIRQFNAGIPIVALSAAVMDEDLALTKAAGMDEHLAKPIVSSELHRILARYVKGIRTTHSVVQTETVGKIYGIDQEELNEKIPNPASRKRFLKLFADTNRTFAESVRQMNVESEAFRHAVHALKGVGGNVSAKRIYTLAREIEAHKDRDKKGQTLTELIVELEKVITSIDRCLSETPEGSYDTPASIEEIKKQLQTLLERIAENEYIDEIQNDTLLNSLERFVDRTVIGEFRRSMESIDYRSAIIILKKIIESIR